MFKNFVRDKSAATAIEYSLVAALIALAIITAAQLAGQNLLAKYNLIANLI